jgi:hypothetical protein
MEKTEKMDRDGWELVRVINDNAIFDTLRLSGVAPLM